MCHPPILEKSSPVVFQEILARLIQSPASFHPVVLGRGGVPSRETTARARTSFERRTESNRLRAPLIDLQHYAT